MENSAPVQCSEPDKEAAGDPGAKKVASAKGGTAKESVAKEVEEKKEVHPYKSQLQKFRPKESELCLSVAVEPPRSLRETPLMEVADRLALENLVMVLRDEEIIGVDVEYSSYGYKGLTALVQISTKTADFFVDAIALKHDMLMLAGVFTNPDILKVLHAAENDLRWLQQDFQLFFINIFDTQTAMRVLNYKHIGLKPVLMEKYGVAQRKNLQKADFRKRPLPQALKEYARIDSHYLINIYHELKNELIEANQLRAVLKTCNELCKVMYDKNKVSPAMKRTQVQNDEQWELYQKLDAWRNSVAQVANMNPGFVLSKKALKDLVLQQPSDQLTILKLSKSSFVKEHLGAVVEIITGEKPTIINFDLARKQNFPNNWHYNARPFKRKWFSENRPTRPSTYPPSYQGKYCDNNRNNYRYHPYQNFNRNSYKMSGEWRGYQSWY